MGFISKRRVVVVDDLAVGRRFPEKHLGTAHETCRRLSLFLLFDERISCCAAL